MSRHTRSIALAAAGLAALACAAPATAQSASSRLAGGGLFESYTFAEPSATGIENITLLTTPYALRLGLGSRVTVSVGGAYATGKLTRADGSESELSGPTDTRVSMSLALIPDGITLTGFFVAPTGESTHDADQAAVAGAVAADLLPFRITNWGSGGGAGMQLTGTRRFQNFGAGLSVGYRQSNEFEPVDGNEVNYRPGDEVRVRLALDTEFDNNAKGSLVVGLQRFGEDAFNESNLFQSGNRVEVTGTLAFPIGYRASGALYGSVLHRANGQFFPDAAGVFELAEEESPTQDLLLFGGILRRAVGSAFVVPRADFRLFRSEDGRGQGYTGSVGLSFELGGDGVTFTPTFAGRFGSIEILEGAESSFTGFEAGATIRFGR
ncbi:MAG: hypothetical protein RJQ04_00265 [Longimicrobiales bacterium]